MIQLFRKAHKTILLYRFLRYRKGFGVHSPFAFNLITKVIDERCPFYCFQTIELQRKKQQQRSCPIHGIKASHGQLLFRLVRHSGAKRILQLGADSGISTLYLTGCASDIRCRVLTHDRESARQTRLLLETEQNQQVQLSENRDYRKMLSEILSQEKIWDFVFFNMNQTTDQLFDLFLLCMQAVHPDSVFVVGGLRKNSQITADWERIKQHPDVVLTFDLYNIGIVFFNKRLHKRNYIVYF